MTTTKLGAPISEHVLAMAGINVSYAVDPNMQLEDRSQNNTGFEDEIELGLFVDGAFQRWLQGAPWPTL